MKNQAKENVKNSFGNMKKPVGVKILKIKLRRS